MQILNNRSGRHSVTEGGLTRPGVPLPRDGERPVAYADRIGEWYAALKSDRHRKDHGLFLTPVPAADFMGRRIRGGRAL